MPPKKKRKVVPKTSRFNFVSDEHLQKKRKDLINGNTVKADKKAEKVFAEWLIQRGIHTDYWDLAAEELDQLLSKFYFEARTVEGELYKTGSLGALRYGINRNLRARGFNYDIVHSSEFAKSCIL